MPDEPQLPDNIAALIVLGTETRSVEYKQSLNWGAPETKAKIVRSALAMSNLSDGGSIVIGVENEPFLPAGMSADDYNSFRNDDVAVEVNRFADPSIELTVTKGRIDGKLFVVVSIAAFRELPTICARDGGLPPERLFAGAVYVRPVGKPETRSIRSQEEMRELVERATDIAVAKDNHRAAIRRAVNTGEDLDRELGHFA